jgi:thiol:disulfide interchange protein
MNTLKMALGVMMLASSLWLTTLLGVHLGETASGMLTLALTVAAPIALLVARPRATPAFWLVIIALAAFGGFQVRGLLARVPSSRRRRLTLSKFAGSLSARRPSAARWRMANGCLSISQPTGASRAKSMNTGC